MARNLDLPKRPRFHWDIRSVPWTDGKKNQAEYLNEVKSWSLFHDKLSNSNSNKISRKLRDHTTVPPERKSIKSS